MDLLAVKKHSAHGLAFSTVFWSCLGGIELGRGIDQILNKNFQYRWITPLMFGTAFLALGVFWAAMLLRRKTAEA